MPRAQWRAHSRHAAGADRGTDRPPSQRAQARPAPGRRDRPHLLEGRVGTSVAGAREPRPAARRPLCATFSRARAVPRSSASRPTASSTSSSARSRTRASRRSSGRITTRASPSGSARAPATSCSRSRRTTSISPACCKELDGAPAELAARPRRRWRRRPAGSRASRTARAASCSCARWSWSPRCCGYQAAKAAWRHERLRRRFAGRCKRSGTPHEAGDSRLAGLALTALSDGVRCASSLADVIGRPCRSTQEALQVLEGEDDARRLPGADDPRQCGAGRATSRDVRALRPEKRSRRSRTRAVRTWRATVLDTLAATCCPARARRGGAAHRARA